jgi:hypothetical protein
VHNISIVSIVIADLAHFLLGMIWYAPFALGKFWVHEVGSRANTSMTPQKLIVSFILALIMAFSLGWLFYYTGAMNFGDRFWVGFVAWAGFIVTTHFSGILWSDKTVTLFIIDVAYLLCSVILMALVYHLLS